MNTKHTKGPWAHDDLPCHDLVKADARLREAAPELLEACERALRFLDKPRNSYDEEQVCEVLRAALAKATGQ